MLHEYQLPRERLYPSSFHLFFLIKCLMPSNGRSSIVCFAAVAQIRTLFQSGSLTTAVSGSTVLALSKYATLLLFH
jgi:hypothetical protein